MSYPPRVKVYANTGSLPDDYGIPMRSIWFVTDTDNPSKIASAIAEYLPAYMDTYGDESCELDGKTYHYQMAETASVGVNIILRMKNGTQFDQFLAERIKDTVIAMNNGYNIGGDYYVSWMRESILNLQDPEHVFDIYRFTCSYGGTTSSSIKGYPGRLYQAVRNNISVTSR